MIKKQGILMVLAYVLFFAVSCDEGEPGADAVDDPSAPLSNPQDVNEVASSLNLKQITYDDGSISFSYNADGKLTSIVDNYEETDDNSSYSSLSTYTFTYDGDRISAISLEDSYTDVFNGETFEGSSSENATLTYNSEGLVTRIDYTETDDDFTDEGYYEREYVDGKLSKETSYYDNTATWYDVFEWSGDNVSKEVWWSVENLPARIRPSKRENFKSGLKQILSMRSKDVASTEVLYTDYDDKKNLFSFFSLVNFDLEGNVVSKNNVGTIRFVDVEDGSEDVINISYTYDGDLVTSFTFNDGDDIETYTVAYN